jgi:hypothetical protein
LPAKPFSMPTACEPWPVNRNANLLILILVSWGQTAVVPSGLT